MPVKAVLRNIQKSKEGIKRKGNQEWIKGACLINLLSTETISMHGQLLKTCSRRNVGSVHPVLNLGKWQMG